MPKLTVGEMGVGPVFQHEVKGSLVWNRAAFGGFRL
jgi:predicted Rdx family selenoprotein